MWHVHVLIIMCVGVEEEGYLMYNRRFIHVSASSEVHVRAFRVCIVYNQYVVEL